MRERGGIFGGHLDMHGDEVADGGEMSRQVGACEGNLGPILKVQ